MKTRQLGYNDLSVSATGLGCMGMTDFYTIGGDRQGAVVTLHRVVEPGLGFFDTVDIYGPHSSEKLLGETLHDKREQVFLTSKLGIVHDPTNPQAHGIDGNPAYIRRATEGSPERLGTGHLDLYCQHRMNPQVPIEDSIGALADLVKAGKIRRIGLSEASAGTLGRARRIHLINVLQDEYSLWTRDPEDTRVLAACYRLGIVLVPYNPLGRGFLIGTLERPEGFTIDNYHRFSLRLQGESFAKNLKLVDKVDELAAAKGAKPSQLALAWVLVQGDDLIPIPGTKQRHYLEENIAATELRLSAAGLTELGTIFPVEAIAGSHYSEGGIRLVNL